jgi:hypothetical protein
MKQMGDTNPRAGTNQEKTQHHSNLLRYALLVTPLAFLLFVSIVLVSIGNSVNINMRFLSSDSDVLKIYAAKRLGRIGHTDAVPLLIDTLTDDNAAVKLATIQALGELGDLRAIEPMGDAIRNTYQDGYIDSDDEMLIQMTILSMLKITGHEGDDEHMYLMRVTMNDIKRDIKKSDPVTETDIMQIILESYSKALLNKDPKVSMLALELQGELVIEIEEEKIAGITQEDYPDLLLKAPLYLYGDWVADWILQGGEIDCGMSNSGRNMDIVFMIPDGAVIAPRYGASSIMLISPKGTSYTVDGVCSHVIFYWDENGRATTTGLMPVIAITADVKEYLEGLNDPRIHEALAGCDDD